MKRAYESFDEAFAVLFPSPAHLKMGLTPCYRFPLAGDSDLANSGRTRACIIENREGNTRRR